MAKYSNEFSSFPSKTITLHRFKNIDDTIAPVINQINSLREQGLYNQATRIIQDNSDILPQYIIDAVTIQTMFEEIHNTQIYAKQVQQSIFFSDEEPECQEGDVWIGG